MGRGGGYGGGERGRLYTYRHTVATRMILALIKMGSDESHSNVSFIVRDKVTRQCPHTTILEEKVDQKRIRTEVPLLPRDDERGRSEF